LYLLLALPMRALTRAEVGNTPVRTRPP
jgi:hypothetical protein